MTPAANFHGTALLLLAVTLISTTPARGQMGGMPDRLTVPFPMDRPGFMPLPPNALQDRQTLRRAQSDPYAPLGQPGAQADPPERIQLPPVHTTPIMTDEQRELPARYRGPLPIRPRTAPASPRSNPRGLEVPPSGATGGLAGAPYSPSNLETENALANVRGSKLPEEVKVWLSSASHQQFIERCQPPALRLSDWRRRQAASTREADVLDGALRNSNAAGLRVAAGIFRSYVESCLTPLEQASSQQLRRLIESRVGLIRAQDGSPVCTATLVAPDMLITARHCVRAPLDERSIRDLRRLTFTRIAEPDRPIALTPETIRTEYYRRFANLAFDRSELHSDLVAIRLSQAIPAEIAASWEPLTISDPELHDPVHAVSFNLYSYRAAQILDGTADWSRHMYVDSSATCMVGGRYRPNLIIHACQTEGASSGAPLVTLSPATGAVVLAAIHTGGFSRTVRHPDIWEQTGIDTMMVPNHAVVVSGHVRDRLQSWAATQQ
ncbi:hypothetical protein STVA_35170 [Allostella vacuolata]|nr:hypothetical protein STVA_35170 [Stella vacuolata]